MPVRFGVSPDDLRWSADGAVTTVIHNPVGGVAPFLIFRSGLHDWPFPQPPHELGLDEKLVGIISGARDVAADLFPDSTVIRIPLGNSHLLLTPPAAWQTLDAVILDGASAQDLPVQLQSELLAGGTTLVADAPSAPNQYFRWHWERGYWVVHARQALVLTDDVFAPIAGWTPGASADYRRGVLILAGIFAVLLLRISLWQSRWTPIAAAVLAAGAIIAIERWDSAQSGVSTAVGVVGIQDELPRMDRWVYQRAFKDTLVHLRSWAIPIVPSRGGPAELTLICNGEGTPIQYQYRLKRDEAAAFVSSTTDRIGGDMTRSSAVTSPLRYLLPIEYRGMNVLGEVAHRSPEGGEYTYWPPLVLASSDAIPINTGGSNGRTSSKR